MSEHPLPRNAGSTPGQQKRALAAFTYCAVPREDPFERWTDLVGRYERLRGRLENAYIAAVEALVDKHNVELATGHMDDMWQARKIPKRKNRGTAMKPAPGDARWQCETDFDPGDRKRMKIFDDLKELDDVAEPLGIGPTNGMFYRPRKYQ